MKTNWTEMVQDRIQQQLFMNMAINVWVP